MKITVKTVLAALILTAVFAGTFFAFAALFNADLVGARSFPITGMIFNSTNASGPWNEQNLAVGPIAGSENVLRNTVLVIAEPRPVRVENITFSPPTAIAQIVDEHFPIASAKITVYPADLLEPNTTYNVSAIVAGKKAWWSFTTGSEPKQMSFTAKVTVKDVFWYSLEAAAFITLATAAFMVVFLKRYKRKRKLL